MSEVPGYIMTFLGAIFIAIAVVVLVIEKDKHGKAKGISTTLFWILVGGLGGLGIILLILGIIFLIRHHRQKMV